MSAREELVRARWGERTVAWPRASDRPESRFLGAVGIPLIRLAAVLAVAAVFFGSNVPALLLVAGVFFTCLERSFAVTYVGLGPATAAVTGAVTSLMTTLLLGLGLPSLGLGRLALAGTALGVCLAVPSVDLMLRKRGAGGGPALMHAVPELATAEGAGPAHLFEDALRRVPPRLVTSEWLAALQLHQRRSLSALVKRAFDIVVAVLGLLLTAPLWILVLVVPARTRGSLFFHQVRVGESGGLFTMYKFRTMRLDAEPLGQAVWAQASDPRVRYGGRFLRETHLDELPQLWNVLKGDMSIVGPRPERPELVPMLMAAIPHWTRRHLVRPGITGWAQVRQGYAADCDGCEEKLSYDLWYIRHRTLLLDLAICLRTFPSLLMRSGAN